MKEVFAIVAALLALASYVPYFNGLLKGRVQPHAYTWGIWSLVSGITLFAQIAKGAGIGAVPTATAALLTFCIFLLSIKFGFRQITRIDTAFLILALVAIIPWLVTKDPTVSVILAVSIDVLGFVPTLRKTWLLPTSESLATYGLNIVRHMLSLFALEAYNVATVLHSAAMLVMNSTIVAVIVRRAGIRGLSQDQKR